MSMKAVSKRKDPLLPSLRQGRVVMRQSVEMTFARYGYTAIEKRIRYVLTYLAFMEGKGKGAEPTPLGRVEMDEYHQRYVTVPIRVLMGSSRSHNYDDIRESVDSFNAKTVWIPDGEGGWFKAYPLVAAYVRKSRGNIILKIDRSVWHCFASESRHYTEFDVLQAMQFRSPLTMRLYEIANTLSGPGEFQVSFLREIFCLDDKYSDTGQFLRTLRRAIMELEKGDVALDLQCLKGNPSSKQITAIRLSPRLNYEGKEREVAIRRTLRHHGLSWLLSPADRVALEEAGFSHEDICRNIVLLKAAQRIMNGYSYHENVFAEKVRDLRNKAPRKLNPQGWIISALRRIVESAWKE